MARGQPDEGTYQPQVQPEDLPRKITPHAEAQDFGAPVAQGVQVFGNTLDQKYQADSATWAGDKVTQARIKAVNDLEAAKASAPDGDQTGFTDKFLAGFDKSNAPLIDSAGGNALARQMVSKGLSDLRQTLQTHSMGWEAAQNVAYREDSVKHNLESQLPIVEAHPEMGAQVGSTLTDQINSIGGDPSRRTALKQNAYQQLSLAEANGLTRQDPHGMYQALNDPENAPDSIKSVLSGLTNEQREVVRSKTLGQLATGYSDNVINTYRTMGPEAGVKAMTAVDSSALPDEIKSQIYPKIEQGVNQWHQEARQKFTPQIVALETRIASGDATDTDKGTAWSLYHSGALDTNQLSAAVGSIERSKQKSSDDTEMLQFATNAYQNKSPLDPSDKRTKDSIDLLFTNMTKGLDPGTPGYANTATDIASRVGIVPASTQNWARANLTSGDPKTAAQAADLVARLGETNPRAELFAEDSKLKAMAASINDAVKAGTDPTTAVNLARANASLPKPEEAALDEKWKQNQNAAQKAQPTALGSILKSDPVFKPGWFSGLPSVPPLMQGEFDQLTQEYFKHTGGNLTQARALAAQDLKKTWGVSEVNGPRELMQYAPEAMFPGLSAAVVRADVAKTVQDNAEALPNVDPSKVRLTATSRTARTGGTDFALSAPDALGAYDVVRGKDGNPLIYRLPVSGTDYAAIKAREAQADLQSARATQQLRRDAEAGREWALEHQGAQ